MMDGQALPSYSVKVETPDGVMFVHIVEQDGMPHQVLINIGKAGTNVNAWGDASARLVSRMLEKLGVYGAIEELSGITTASVKHMANGESCRSGPEGIAIALLKYRSMKFRENKLEDRDGRASVRE